MAPQDQHVPEPAFRLVPISAGRHWAKVDAADYDAVMSHRWALSRSGNRRTLYAHRRVGRTTQMMHTFLTGMKLVDHINHDGLDNRRANLRDGAGGGNERNQRKTASTSSSGYKGVSWRRADRSHGDGWEANILANGKNIYLGKFADERDAAAAYDQAALEHFGEFACLNFPRELTAVGGAR